LSGSRSCGDARALSNSSWNTIFKVPPGGGEGDGVQKSSVSRSKSDNQAHASPWNDDQMYFAVSSSHSIGANPRSTPKIVQFGLSRTGQF
jgi:hypothetical protein